MSCTEIRNLFSDTIDGRASVTDIAAVDRHVAGCAACRTEMEDLRRVLAAVKSLPQRKAPAGFAQGVMSRIATTNRLEPVPHAPRRTPRLATVLKFAASAAAAVIVCVGIVRIADRGPAPVTTVGSVKSPAEKEAPADGIKLREAGDSLAKKLQSASESLKANADDKVGEVLDTEKELAGRKAGFAAASKDYSKEPGGLSLQKITVYSSDVAGDSEQVAKVLRASGYTFSSAGEDGRMLVKVPKAEAAQILASLEKSRARVELGDSQKLERAEKQAQEAGIADASAAKADGLVAKADQLEGAFERLRELRSENDRRRGADREAEKRKKSQEGVADAAGGMDGGWNGESAKTAGGEAAGAPRNGASRGPETVPPAGKAPGKEGKSKDKNDEEKGAAAGGGSIRDPKPAGAVPPGDAPAEEARQDGGKDPQAPEAPSTAEGAEHNESEHGGREDDLKELKKDEDAGLLQEEPVLGDELGKQPAELDEVFLVIEFRTGPPPAADPAPKPAK